MQQALESCALDLAYHKCLYQCELAQHDEQSRRLRVQLFIQESENDDLHAQIAEDDDYLHRVQSNLDVLREKVRRTEASIENAQGDIRIKAREIETLKVFDVCRELTSVVDELQAELSSLHGVTLDSTKLLTEKLALSRELSSLRPEIDHLRSQAVSNQALLADKLSLEYRIGTLQVELDNEKKATQRVLAREDKARNGDAEIEGQLEVLRVDINRERREKQKLERQAQQISSTWEAQKMALESRMDSLKNKLKTTKDALKETQQELQKARSTAGPAADQRAASAMAKSAAPYPRKRTALQMLSDSAIGTPGDPVNGKRSNRSSTLPGDKSTFSITPYLNRTASLAPNSPAAAVALAPKPATNGDIADSARDAAVTVAEQDNTPAIEERRYDKAAAFSIAKASKTNAKVDGGQNKPKTAAILEKVAEEEHDENGEVLEDQFKNLGCALEDQSILGGAEAKRKKRKLLGGLSRTLFDDDDREPFKSASETRAFGSLSKGTLLGSKSRPMLAASSASNNGFGVFSPLKRNIRANVGA